MKYILCIKDHTGTSELEFDSLKVARAELTTRLDFARNNGSSIHKNAQDDYTTNNYWQGKTQLWIMRSRITNPLHVTIAVGNWKNYRVFRTCDTLHKYIQTILNKGYHAFITDITESGPITGKRTSDWNTMCSEIFDLGLILKKDGMKDIHVYETTTSTENKQYN